MPPVTPFLEAVDVFDRCRYSSIEWSRLTRNQIVTPQSESRPEQLTVNSSVRRRSRMSSINRNRIYENGQGRTTVLDTDRRSKRLREEVASEIQNNLASPSRRQRQGQEGAGQDPQAGLDISPAMQDELQQGYMLRMEDAANQEVMTSLDTNEEISKETSDAKTRIVENDGEMFFVRKRSSSYSSDEENKQSENAS